VSPGDEDSVKTGKLVSVRAVPFRKCITRFSRVIEERRWAAAGRTSSLDPEDGPGRLAARGSNLFIQESTPI